MSVQTIKVKGKAKEAKGKVKKTVGRATGNDRMQASGRADLSEGKGQAALGDAGQKIKKIAKAITGE